MNHQANFDCYSVCKIVKRTVRHTCFANSILKNAIHSDCWILLFWGGIRNNKKNGLAPSVSLHSLLKKTGSGTSFPPKEIVPCGGLPLIQAIQVESKKGPNSCDFFRNLLYEQPTLTVKFNIMNRKITWPQKELIITAFRLPITCWGCT